MSPVQRMAAACRRYVRHALLFCFTLLCILPSVHAATELPVKNATFDYSGDWKLSDPNQISYDGGRLRIADLSDNTSYGAESELFDVRGMAQLDAWATVTLQSAAASSGVAVAIRFYDGNAAALDASTTRFGWVVGAAGVPVKTRVSAVIPPAARSATVYLYTGLGAKATAWFDNVRFTATRVEDLGAQVYGARSSNAVFDGENTLYVAASGNPAKLAVYDVDTGKRRTEIVFPTEPGQDKGEDIWAITVASDRSVYIGSATGRLYRYEQLTLDTHRFRQVHKFAAGTVIWTLKPGANDDVFGGVSATSTVFQAFNYKPGRNPDAPLTITLGIPPSAEASTKYVRSLAVDQVKSRLYWGLGTTAAAYRSDFSGNDAQRILDDSGYSYTYYSDYVDGKLFVTLDSASVKQSRVIDETGAATPLSAINSIGVSALGPNRRVYYTKARPSDGQSTLYYYDLANSQEVPTNLALSQVAAFTFLPRADPTHLVACLRAYGEIVRIRLSDLTVESRIPFSRPETAVDIRTIAASGGKVYTSGFAEGGLAIRRNDPGSGQPDTIQFEPRVSAQAEGFAVAGARLYAGLYMGAQITAFDITETGLANPKSLPLPGTHRQDRPFAMLALTDPTINKLVIGTVPERGSDTVRHEGALAIRPLDADTAAWDLRSPIRIGPDHDKHGIPGQTIMALTNIGSVVYGGTSTWGAFGEKPAAGEEAKLFSFDVNDAARPPTITTIPGAKIVNSLITVNDAVWGLAGNVLFIHKPGQALVIKEFKQVEATVDQWDIAWNVSRMADPGNGYVYLNAGRNLYRIPKTDPGVIELVVDGAKDGAVEFVTADDRGDLYYRSHASLKRLDLPAE